MPRLLLNILLVVGAKAAVTSTNLRGNGKVSARARSSHSKARVVETVGIPSRCHIQDIYLSHVVATVARKSGARLMWPAH